MKKLAKFLGLLLLGFLFLAASVVGFLWFQFERSMAKVYDIPIPKVTLVKDPATLARGEHLARSIGACAASDCHGADLTGGKITDLGPLGIISSPNLTQSGLGSIYTDGELVRLMRHGVTREGKGVKMMPIQDFNWLPMRDLLAIVAWMRSLPPVKKTQPPTHFGFLAKILDRLGAVHFDPARRVDHLNLPQAPPPEPTAKYGVFIAVSCKGCHGETFAGGKIPGAPPSLPIPTNITPHETGLKTWTFKGFEHLIATGRRPDGTTLKPFMPLELLKHMNDIERKALWAYLQSLPPKPLGLR